MLAFIAFEIINLLFSNSRSTNKAQATSSINSNDYIPCSSCVHPDIYYLIFDGYTSSAVLKSEFGYDNHYLDSFLSRKKFNLIRNSVSNYNLTPFSIGSTLNFDYNHSLDIHQEFYLNQYLSGVSRVYNNELVPILRKEGYEIYNHSIFDFRNAPSTIPPFDQWEIKDLYRRHNIFKKINTDIGWLVARYFPGVSREDVYFNYGVQRDQHSSKAVADLLHTIQLNTKIPKFIYCHLLIPHEPYTRDSLGKPILYTGKINSLEVEKKAYVNQLVYTNRIIDTIINSIFLHSKHPSIIILQGDHGYRHPGQRDKRLEFANLNAIYFYNQEYRSLHDSLSNVNTFRVVLNTFFRKNYPLLQDTSYFLQYK